MERHAHYTVVGVITCLLALALAAFVVWLGQSQFDRQYDLYRIVFQGPIRGLSQGADVQFNGIKVGVIQQIRLNPADPAKVILAIRVDRGTPVHVDSLATTEMQGISGLDVVEISAGTASQRLLRDVDHSDRPTIRADRDALASLVVGGQQVLQGINTTLGRADRVLSDDNLTDLAHTMRDLRQTGDALAAHRALFGRIDRAAGDIAASAGQVRGMVHGDGHQALADLAVAAHDFKDTAHLAHGLVAGIDGAAASRTIPRLNATIDSVGRAADAAHGLIRDLHNDPRALLTKPKGRELEIGQ